MRRRPSARCATQDQVAELFDVSPPLQGRQGGYTASSRPAPLWRQRAMAVIELSTATSTPKASIRSGAGKKAAEAA